MPARLSAIRDVLRGFGGDIEVSGGSHPYKATMQGKRPYTVPAHGGWKTEIGDDYIKGLCRAFGLDKADFIQRLRGK